MRGARRRPRWRRCVRSKKASTRVGRSRPAGSSVGSNLPRKLPVPDALRRDLRRTLRVVFSRPSRLRRLLALGPRGWSATARFLAAVVPRAGRELARIRERAARIPDALLREQALALIDALDDRRDPIDYYRDGPAGDDAGYLRSLVESARSGLRALPNYHAVRDPLVEVARF